jgi:D-arabinitol 2-dehydrogenase
VNILGSFYVARESAKVMKPGSSIVMIGSMSGVVINVPQPQTPYNFSSESDSRCPAVMNLIVQYLTIEAAVIHMVKSLAVEWAPKGIRVNCISWVQTRYLCTTLKADDTFLPRPGYVLTNLTKVILDKDTKLRDEWVNRVPMVSRAQ